MTMRQALLGFSTLLLAGAAQFSISSNVSAQQADLRAKVFTQSPAVRAAVEVRAESARQARALAYPPFLHSSGIGHYRVFDAPGAAQGTSPTSINLEGTITGQFTDTNGEIHGFLRAANGAFTTFDVPFGNVYGTVPFSISLTGAITGYFNDVNGVSHGFLRAPNGVIATFDAPGALFTYPAAISLSGEVAGFLFDANFVEHGFIRTPNGNLSTFDAPGASGGTTPLAISGLGTIAGAYSDANANSHGFLRAISGAFTSFDAPGNIGVGDLSGDLTFAVNPQGVIAGAYFQPIAGNPFGGNYQVFIRALNGTITTFATGTNSPCCTWSWPTGINLDNAIVGVLNDGYNINHGFFRASNGSITTFDAPGAGVGFGEGTVPVGITSLGEITGRFIDSNRVAHGFILIPAWSGLSSAR
jgi:hypothetical protein